VYKEANELCNFFLYFSLESVVTWGTRRRTKNFDTTTLCAN